jgi:hypothetical protein
MLPRVKIQAGWDDREVRPGKQEERAARALDRAALS